MPIAVDLYERRLTLDKTLVTLGREDSNDVVVTGVSVSRRHCELRVEGGGLSCLDRSTSGTAVIEGAETVRLPPQTWTPVPLDASGWATLVLGGIGIRVGLVSAADAGALDTGLPPHAQAQVGEGRGAAPVASQPRAPAASPRRGPGFDLLAQLVAAGEIDPTEPVGDSPAVARLLEALREVAGALVALERRYGEHETRQGLVNPLKSLIASRDPNAWVRALVSEKTGSALAARLGQALAIVGRREDALLAAFTTGVEDLLAELEPERAGLGRRGALGLGLDRAVREYVAFFKDVAGGGWREAVLGRSFVSRFEEGVDRDRER